MSRGSRDKIPIFTDLSAALKLQGVARFLWGWLKALRWQRLPEMEKLGDTLVNHFDGIAAYCDHPVRCGVVESLNTTIKAVLRRARGMRTIAAFGNTRATAFR